MLKQLSLKNFTAFDEITIDFAPGINIIIGENGTGKTHLMKVAYAISRPVEEKNQKKNARAIANKLVDVFIPEKRLLGSFARRPLKAAFGDEDNKQDTEIKLQFHDYEGDFEFAATLDFKSKKNFKTWDNAKFQGFLRRPVFVPTKEVISFIRDIVMQYDLDDTLIDDTYIDVCQDLDEELIDGPSTRADWAMDEIQELCGGQFIYNEGKVVFKAKNNESHSSLMIAEGYRKLGVLYRLIENLSINPSVGGTLFWDEPDANLNPRLLNLVAKVFIQLARLGQQIVVSTHNYVLLKEIELERRPSDSIRYNVLYRSGDGVVAKHASEYSQLDKNVIAETYSSLFDRDLKKSVERMEQ